MAAERRARYPAGEDFDTAEEQAQALLHDLRESFAPTYLTLISIIEGVLLGLIFELISEGRSATGFGDPASLLVFNNIVLIALVWIPSLADAVIPFTVGALQAALILTTERPVTWLAWLAVLYAASLVAYMNMYLRAAAEERNALVLWRNRVFRWLNPVLSGLLAVTFAVWAALHHAAGTTPGMVELVMITAANLLFLARGEVNWQLTVRAARRLAEPTGEERGPAPEPVVVAMVDAGAGSLSGSGSIPG
jgi:hypothetical protein